MTGEVVSCTTTNTSVEDIPPRWSSTINVTVVEPCGMVAVGVELCGSSNVISTASQVYD
jgi:hypothetical protein